MSTPEQQTCREAEININDADERCNIHWHKRKKKFKLISKSKNGIDY